MPVVIGGIVIAVVLVIMASTVTRGPGFTAKLSQEYTSLMAGSLAPDLAFHDPEQLASALERAGLPFRVRIPSLGPTLRLAGGRVSEVHGHRAAAWIYRSEAADSVLGEAMQASVNDLGPPDERRSDSHRPLALYRKMTQTLVCWQEGPLLYVIVSTLPSEQVVALARVATAGAGSTSAPL
jgi:hypothetical protein